MQQTIITQALLLLLAFYPAAAGQNHFHSDDSTSPDGPASIFRAIEQGLARGDERIFSVFFSRTVSLNVRGNSPGYYSANQAGQVLRHFLASRKIPSFRFTTLESDDHPFATGSATMTVGGRIERFQVYAGLTRDKSGWVISQFNIY